MSRFPSGFFAVSALLFLSLAVSTCAHGSEIVISETEWNNLKLNYAMLKDAQIQLSTSLSEAESKSQSLNSNLAKLWLQLNDSKVTALSLEARLLTAKTQAELLRDQLIESENGLSELSATMRKEKIRAGLIGAGVGVGATLVVGLLIMIFGG